ncbi:MAG TPA: hypothetical protein VE988_00085 [Gemmataceae bacterium]|nr:hypothetical protein [Gemmataceae bacterium]
MIDPQFREESHQPVSNRVLRQFAGLWTLLFGALAYFRGIADQNTLATWIFLALAIMPGLAGLALPAIIRPVFVLATLCTRPIGWVVSQLILLVLFFGVFTPVAIVFKLIGRDALTRSFRPDLQTYWVAKPPAPNMRSYFRLS